MKLETMASPASRSDCGRRLHSDSVCVPGASGLLRVKGGSFMASSHRQPKVATDFIRQVDHELPIVRRDREPEPGERFRCWARDVGAVAAILRTVAGTEKAVSQLDRRAVTLQGLCIGQRLGA